MDSQNSRPTAPSIQELRQALEDTLGDSRPPRGEVGGEVKADILSIDVGGEVISTLPSTFPSTSIIHSMLESKLGCRNKDGLLFLDRDPETFKRILNCLRTGRVFTSDYGELISMHVEAEYLGLPELKYQLQIQLHFNCFPTRGDVPVDALEDEPKLFLFLTYQVSPHKANKYELTCEEGCQMPPHCSTFKLSVPPQHILSGTRLNKLYALNPNYDTITSMGERVTVLNRAQRSGTVGCQPAFGLTYENKFYVSDLRHVRGTGHRYVFFLITKDERTPSISDLIETESLIMQNWEHYWDGVCYAGGSATEYLIKEVTPKVEVLYPDIMMPLPSMEGVPQPVDDGRPQLP